MKKLLFFLLLSSALHSQGIINPYRFGSAPPPSNPEVRINFSLNAVSVATYNNLSNHPHLAIRSIANLVDITGANTGWSISSVATGNWNAFSAASASNTITTAITGMSFLSGATSDVWGTCYFSYGGEYNVANPQFRFSGLDISKTYEIKIACADGTNSFDADPTRVRVVGATSPAFVDLNGNSGAIDVSTGATFTLQPDGSGQITIWINKVGASSEYITVNAMIIKQL